MKSPRSYARFASTKVDDFLARRMAKPLNLWMGCGYPRSGTTWVCRLLSSYLDLPWAKLRTFPSIRGAVLHSHFNYHPGVSNCFYVYRDGRDALASEYFYRVRVLYLKDHPNDDKWQKIFTTLYGPGFDLADVRNNLPQYLEYCLTASHFASLTWPEHIRAWVQPRRGNVAFLRYEDLLQDTFDPISRGLAQFLNEPINESRLRASIEEVSFAKWTGRQPGEEDLSNFFRKGVAGDWRNHFTREAAEIFAEYAGEALVSLGYEQNFDWVKAC